MWGSSVVACSCSHRSPHLQIVVALVRWRRSIPRLRVGPGLGQPFVDLDEQDSRRLHPLCVKQVDEAIALL